jgi:hypothetical protein
MTLKIEGVDATESREFHLAQRFVGNRDLANRRDVGKPGDWEVTT